MRYISPDTPIEELELSIRVSNCLRGAVEQDGFRIRPGWRVEGGVRDATVKDFLQWTPAEMYRLPNFGKKSLEEWLEVVACTKLKPPTKEERLRNERDDALNAYRRSTVTQYFDWRNMLIWRDSVVLGRRMKDIAKEYDVSAGRVSQTVKSFGEKVWRRETRLKKALKEWREAAAEYERGRK
tara:strand:- start:14458 stop:15003 length:546 start_codon:yes stop_codon:yes gene_type:complete